MRHADGELQTLLAESAPPVDLQRVALFRSVCRKQEKKAGTRMSRFMMLFGLLLDLAQIEIKDHIVRRRKKRQQWRNRFLSLQVICVRDGIQ